MIPTAKEKSVLHFDVLTELPYVPGPTVSQGGVTHWLSSPITLLCSQSLLLPTNQEIGMKLYFLYFVEQKQLR